MPQRFWVVPMRQLLPSQQPAQLFALHEGCIEQAPLLQVPPMPHCMQVLPPVPQAKRFWVEPGTQTPLRQQPLAQVIALQVEVMEQEPLEQVLFDGQVMQAAPAAPQAAALCSTLGTHWPLRQQPLGHVIGLHC